MSQVGPATDLLDLKGLTPAPRTNLFHNGAQFTPESLLVLTSESGYLKRMSFAILRT